MKQCRHFWDKEVPSISVQGPQSYTCIENSPVMSMVMSHTHEDGGGRKDGVVVTVIFVEMTIFKTKRSSILSNSKCDFSLTVSFRHRLFSVFLDTLPSRDPLTSSEPFRRVLVS